MGSSVLCRAGILRGVSCMLLLLLLFCFGENEFNQPQAYPEEERANLPMFTMDYSRIQIPFEITLWVLLASFAKIGFHIYHKITIWIPESCLLIAIGLIVGAIMHAVKEEPPAVLTSNVFFLYMLPLIVLDNGYFMPTRPFFENVGTVLWYAVVGTLWNSIGIGLSLFAICQFEVFGVQDINLQENLLFASIISAVDPVAALNVFEDIGVNEQIYIVIFGEGLYNDAVTVVLYNMFSFLADMPVVESTDVFLGVARFFIVAAGGILFGLLFGFVAAFTTRFTHNVRQIEPLFVFMYSYMAYLVAECFAISSVLAIITCAITMKHYVEEKRIAEILHHHPPCGQDAGHRLRNPHLLLPGCRYDNHGARVELGLHRVHAAVCLHLERPCSPSRTSLASPTEACEGQSASPWSSPCPININRKNLFVTASIAVIIFTVFLQGISIRPIVEYMNIRKTNKDLSTINVEMMEHVVCGIEDLCGQWSHYYWKDKFKKFNDRVLRRILVRDNRLSPASWLCTRDWSCRTPLGYWTHRWETSVQRHPSSLCTTRGRKRLGLRGSSWLVT
ncbi:hypothetical protein KUCAC02_001097 [Chaenocephalus aceratus]|uniref:Uncharacterized protein n=1 Tax=Chaenocephalus aceratus TaxID=36190 RepID=A0ACB9XX67_CHAAC|nr:hypothetical protein KUCAC02_001097 [Chaenocephalus aceratus]